MKLINLLEQDYTVEQVIVTILRDCEPYLRERSNFAEHPLYRGVQGSQPTVIRQRKTRNNRIPKDASEFLHEVMDRWFINNLGHPYRSAGLFVTPAHNQADDYGTPYIVFPIGEFHYIWSYKVYDLVEDIQNELSNTVTRVINQYYSNTNKAIMEQLKRSTIDLIYYGIHPTEHPEANKVGEEAINNVLDDFNFQDDDLEKAVEGITGEVTIACEAYYTIDTSFYNDENLGDRIEGRFKR